MAQLGRGMVVVLLAAAALVPSLTQVGQAQSARPVWLYPSFSCSQPRPVPAAARRPDPKINALLTEYATDPTVLDRKVTTLEAFNELDKALPAEVERWKADRRRLESVLLLDLADHGFLHHWPYWVEVLDLGRQFMTSRPERPGANPADDAFELAWHKAAAGLVAFARRPELFEDCIVRALAGRIAPAAGPDGAASRLIDPWFALVQGFAEESYTLSDRSLLQTRGRRALSLFDEAAAFPSTRGEALVRKARLQIRLGECDEALRTLDAAGDPASDTAVRYWARLLRGRALEGAGQPEAAARAYRETLMFAPRTQSPTVALMALAYSREQSSDALASRDAIRSGQTDAPDPWWQYDDGEGRFYTARLEALRQAARR